MSRSWVEQLPSLQDATDGEHISRPLPISSGLAVLSGLIAVIVVTHRTSQLMTIGIVLVGLVGIAVGVEAHHRDYGRVAGVLTAVGALVVVIGLGWGLTATRGISPKLELVPGTLGLVLLVLGLVAAVPGSDRWFVGLGTGTILLSVFFNGLVYDASAVALLAGAAAAVVAWDLGEQAINGGEQIGRQAYTWPVEVAHGAVTILVGVFAVILAISINGMGVTELPLVALWTLFGAGVVLAAALYI